jgi:hypothetical protein
MGILCVVVISFGTMYVSPILIADITTSNSSNSYLKVIDFNHRLSIHIDFPIIFARQYSSPTFNASPNGHRFILTKEDSSLTQFVVWDIFTGHMIDLSEKMPDCSVLRPRWLSNSREITFSCYNTQNSIYESYKLDFETGKIDILLVPAYSFRDINFSPNSQYVAFDISNSISIINLENKKEQVITPIGKWHRFIAWSNDNQSIFAHNLHSIERYNLVTDSWDMVMNNIEISENPILSPDGKWILLISGFHSRDVYALNLESLESYSLLSVEDQHIENARWAGNSEWVIIHARSSEAFYIYRVRPDSSELESFSTSQRSVWSSDANWVGFITANNNSNLSYSELTLWNLASHNSLIFTIPFYINPVWLFDDGGLVFIHYAENSRLGYVTKTGDIYFLTGESENVRKFLFVK